MSSAIKSARDKQIVKYMDRAKTCTHTYILLCIIYYNFCGLHPQCVFFGRERRMALFVYLLCLNDNNKLFIFAGRPVSDTNVSLVLIGDQFFFPL